MASSFTLGIQQVSNGKNSGDVCIRFVIKRYIIPTLKSFIPSFFFFWPFSLPEEMLSRSKVFQTSRMSLKHFTTRLPVDLI